MNVFDKFRLDGKIAMVTGGSRGLGLEIAEGLAQAGAEVVLMARREAYFPAALERIPEALTLTADVSQPESWDAALNQTTERFGPVDILVNGAGISWGAPSMDMPYEKILQVINVNLVGTILGCQKVGAQMVGRGGKVVNVASVAGLKGEPPEVLDAIGYAASKGGVVALTRDLAVKWGRHDIQVNALAPGFFPSKMTEKVLPRISSKLSQLPAGRAGEPGELAAAALFLASPASDYVTGHVLVVDGGAVAG